MEYIAHPAEWVFKIADNMSFEEGALVEPLAVGINAAKTGGVSLGRSVLIYGAGCIGLMSLLAAKAYGATAVFVADILDKRLQTAKELGGIPLNPNQVNVTDEIMKATGGRGADVVLDCAGASETVIGSIHACGAGGTIVIVGLASDILNGIPLGPVSAKELVITSIFRYKSLYPTAVEAIAGGKISVKEIVSNRYKFEDTPLAFAETLKNVKDVVKSVIVYN
jgi:L-iditol 2-dehydrogenase